MGSSAPARAKAVVGSIDQLCQFYEKALSLPIDSAFICSYSFVYPGGKGKRIKRGEEQNIPAGRQSTKNDL
jgi:hypothetical protein